MQATLKSLFAVALMASACGASAAVLAGVGPSTLVPQGEQADNGTGAYITPISIPANATLDALVWWGYRGDALPGGPYDDAFVVKLGSNTPFTSGITSVIEQTLGNVDLVKYTLNLGGVRLSASTLSIVNDVTSFEWYWQASTASSPTSFAPAFNLIGTFDEGTVPEPSSLLLAALAGLSLLATTRRRSR